MLHKRTFTSQNVMVPDAWEGDPPRN